MATIRRRLTLWYTVALATTVLAFGAALYFERTQASIRELDERLGIEAELAQRWLTQSYKVLGRIVTTTNLNPTLDPAISAYLEAARDYLIVADSIEQSRMESGDLLLGFASESEWERVVELKDVTAGRFARNRPTDITVFKSNGLAVEDVIAAGWVYERAQESGAGRPIYS